MEGRFEFSGAEVLALVEESRRAKERLLTEAQRYVAAGVDLHADDAAAEEEPDYPETGAPPGLWLMNDRGVYLRSNAARRPDDRVAYAHGYRAEVPVGEGDACEFIDAATLEQLRPDDTLVVSASEQRLRLSVMRPA
jgi:hypothetical protein